MGSLGDPQFDGAWVDDRMFVCRMTSRRSGMQPGLEMEQTRVEYINQLETAYEKAWDALMRRKGSQALTPDPVGDPAPILQEMAELLTTAITHKSHSVRATCGHAGMLRLSELAGWMPAYSQIAKERDELIRQGALAEDEWKSKQRGWEAERSDLMRTLTALRADRDAVSSTRDMPPAAGDLNHQSSGSDSASEGSPVNRGKRSSVPQLSESDSSASIVPATKREPVVMLRRLPSSTFAPRHDGESGKSPRPERAGLQCPVCENYTSRLVGFGCLPCRRFWRRLQRMHREGRRLPFCGGHPDRRPGKCSGCRREAYERAFFTAHPHGALAIPSVYDTGFQGGEECEPQGLTETPHP
uniref:Uncharacterized protein n=1 Tax=Lygus hesperus TaxID=30085 RepID=A0A0K8TAH9_LYGHE